MQNLVPHYANHSKYILCIGWNEWCALPELDIPYIKAKIDTGAKTSAMHAFDITTFTHKNKTFSRFKVNPIKNNHTITRECSAELVDYRYVMSSNGHKEPRFVIRTSLILGSLTWNILITLTNRDPLQFRMLLGREALANKVIISPGRSCLLGKVTKSILANCYST